MNRTGVRFLAVDPTVFGSRTQRLFIDHRHPSPERKLGSSKLRKMFRTRVPLMESQARPIQTFFSKFFTTVTRCKPYNMPYIVQVCLFRFDTRRINFFGVAGRIKGRGGQRGWENVCGRRGCQVAH